MKKAIAAISLVVATAVLALGLTDGFKSIKELLTGAEEVPYVSTTSDGKFEARINKEETEITYTLSYSALEGDVQQSHIHVGQKGVNGGISVFLCSNLGNGPAGTQPCPPAPATISGTITAADVSPPIPATLAARNQGVNTGELAELIAAIRSGDTYVNVHSSKFPGGEIRSQISREHGHEGGK
jgi:CHRD domain-containing protein